MIDDGNKYSISLLGYIFYLGIFGLGVGFVLFGILKHSEDTDFVILMLISAVYFLMIISAVSGVDVESDGIRIKYLILRKKILAFREINRLEVAKRRRGEYLRITSKAISFHVFIGRFLGIRNSADLIELIIEKAGLVQVHESRYLKKFEAEGK